MGDLQINLHQGITKQRLNRKGEPLGENSSQNPERNQKALDPKACGNCYGAIHPASPPMKCCNTCDDVKEAFMNSGRGLDLAVETEQCQNELDITEKHAQPGEGCRFSGHILANRVAGNFHIALGKTFHRGDRLVHQFEPGQQYTYNSSHIIHR